MPHYNWDLHTHLVAASEDGTWVEYFHHDSDVKVFDDVVTPDPTTCGGLAESRAIANRAEENYVFFSPHNVCGPVGTMACVHLGASVANFGVLEFHALEVDWWDDLLTRSDPLIEDGYVTVPEAPGLGVELDEDVAAEHAKGDGDLWS